MSHSHCLTVREGDKKFVRQGEKAYRIRIAYEYSPEHAKGKLTLDRTEAPTFILAVVVGGGTPEVTVLTPDTSAVVEPLAIIQEG